MSVNMKMFGGDPFSLVHLFMYRYKLIFSLCQPDEFHRVEFFQPDEIFMSEILVKIFNQLKLTFSSSRTEFIRLNFICAAAHMKLKFIWLKIFHTGNPSLIQKHLRPSQLKFCD